MVQSEASKPRKARIDLRMSVEQKELIEKAAELTGLSLTGFLLSTCLPAAIAIIREYQEATETEPVPDGNSDQAAPSGEENTDRTDAADEQDSTTQHGCIFG